MNIFSWLVDYIEDIWMRNMLESMYVERFLKILGDYKFIMHGSQAGMTCIIVFLDCRGYYDLAAEIIGLLLAGLILYRAMANFRELRNEKNNFADTEYELSLRRKIRVNLLNIIFLSFFIIHLAFSMILFQIANEKTPTQVTDLKLQKWYKGSEICFVEMLNVLLLTVGWLYWKGLNFFYKVKQLQAPLFFRDSFRYFIAILALYCLSAFVTGVIMIFVQADNDQFVSNLLILISSILSMGVFLFFRLSYYSNIFRSVKVGSKVVNRERAYNIFVILSSLARVSLCLMSMSNVDLDQVRNYNSQCHDTSPQHGLILMGMTICVDLLPSYVLTRIFTTFERQRHMHADIEQTLFSMQPSEMISGISRD